MDFREASSRATTTSPRLPVKRRQNRQAHTDAGKSVLALACSDVRMMLLDGQVVWRVWDHNEQRYVYMDSPPQAHDRRSQARRALDRPGDAPDAASQGPSQTAIAMTG